MDTHEVRGVKVLLPSDDEPPVSSWPFPAPLEQERVTNTDFHNVDLSSHRLTDVTLNRCRFVGSRLMGVVLTRVTMADVLFQGCQFDYAMWENVRLTGDVAFIDCSFRETAIATSDLKNAVFDNCTLAAEITSTTMTGTDIRGSDLSGLSGLTSLSGANVAESQLRSLIEVMVRDLNLTVAETG
ncbi:uncharacterized protein YjbI with pentapeptide repeats [Murinocardiopsis flavida]|uniref:Uncharacterized protein YjbI with pentapeptide repeats n=1 Tax=Murinocardiopsis flavida TaxID=645275 RepID=A0A2P8DI17_9ACTN|nr:pentapeptide repeat-containing protein [Murinocardiopsis flavida]PSK96874.1 uncharacterized protein YjbI with pentapeptide repeats [Murinocardiopsis flavida]